MKDKLTDEALMARYQAGADEKDLGEITCRYIEKMYGFALAIVRNREDAQDAVQECFIRLIRRSKTYKAGMPFSPWLFSILRNICIDIIRSKKRKGQEIQEAIVIDTQSDIALDIEKKEVLYRALQELTKLPQIDREVLSLRIQGSLKFSEIAEICGISEDAAKKRAYRGLETLRKSLSLF
jgi:RNA polymerase sigma-70 factor (ECF subfamily)